jgi:hypothetical protein
MKNFIAYIKESYKVLKEAAYDNKLQSLLNKNPEHSQLIIDSIKAAKRILGTNVDRIMWFLKYLETNLNKKNIDNLLDQLEQFGLNIFKNENRKVSKVIFGNKTLQTIMQELYQAEREDFDRFSTRVIPTGNDQVILSFPDGTQWWYVDRGSCPKEGISGKHCGNAAGTAKNKQRILSLRDSKGQVILTFILEEDDTLGEMKAKGNQKPQEKYHPQIMSLLTTPEFKIKDTSGKIIRTFAISGISNRYIPGINFSIFDLSEKDLQIIHQYNTKFIVDQIKTTPIDMLNAPSSIKELYRETLKQHKPWLSELLDDPMNVQKWETAIGKDISLILFVPKELWNDIPVFMIKLTAVLSASDTFLLNAPTYITKDYNILSQVIGMNPDRIKMIRPTYKQYFELCKIAVKKSPLLIRDLESSNFTENEYAQLVELTSIR